MKKNLEIERLRAVAILIVLNCHLGEMRILPEPYFAAGWMGVDLFFVISGFLISLSLFSLLPTFREPENFLDRVGQSKPALKIFFTKRFYRILPLAATWVVISILLSALFNKFHTFGRLQDALAQAFRILTLQYNYAYANGSPSDLFLPYWSLMVEEHFYLLFPFFLILFSSPKKRLYATVAGIFLVAVVLRVYFPPPNINMGHSLSLRKFDALFAGVLLALLKEKHWGTRLKNISKLIAWPVVIFCILGIWAGEWAFSRANIHSGGMSIIWILSAILVFAASLEEGFVLEVPILKNVLEYIGSRSYSLYLVHWPVLKFIQETSLHFDLRAMTTSPALFRTMFLGLSLIFAELSYRLIERPAVDRGKKITAAWKKA